jgi:CRISPR-associated protein Cas6
MPVIDLSFVLVGKTIPLDHGYSLFSALCRIVPALHGNQQAGVHPIRGQHTAPRILSLTNRSRLKVRIPSEQIAPFIAIAGQSLELDGNRVQVGIPSVEPLVPSPVLASRLVTFKNALEPGQFLADVRRELDRQKIAATPQLVPATRPQFAGQALRRVLRVRDRRVVGFSLRIFDLTAEESIRLQETGLGGRRRMGCGVLCQTQASPRSCTHR